jgi:hypothetical protein
MKFKADLVEKIDIIQDRLIVSLETVHDLIKDVIEKSTKGNSRNITNIEALI